VQSTTKKMISLNSYKKLKEYYMNKKNEQINICIEKELKEKIFQQCEKEDISVSNYIRRLIREKLNANT
jgi:predicted HicB family RNase H-like nuclease